MQTTAYLGCHSPALPPAFLLSVPGMTTPISLNGTMESYLTLCFALLPMPHCQIEQHLKASLHFSAPSLLLFPLHPALCSSYEFFLEYCNSFLARMPFFQSLSPLMNTVYCFRVIFLKQNSNKKHQVFYYCCSTGSMPR